MKRNRLRNLIWNIGVTKKKWRRHWNIKLNSGWSSGNSFNENQYTKTYTYIQIWCNHRESDREKVEPSFKSSNMISISRKEHFYLFCEINFTKKKIIFSVKSISRKILIYFFDSDSIWYHDDADFIWRNECARNFFFFEEIFFHQI